MKKLGTLLLLVMLSPCWSCDKPARVATTAPAATRPIAELKKFLNLSPALAAKIVRWDTFQISENDWGVCMLVNSTDRTLFGRDPERPSFDPFNANVVPNLPAWFKREAGKPVTASIRTDALDKSPLLGGAAV